MIEIEHLSVVFGQRSSLVIAVDDVSLRVDRGESFGLVGESGSGKSTVLRAIAGLVDDWTGSIVVAGQAQGKHRTLQFRREVQMVFQDPYGSLHPRHTVNHILKEPLKIHRLDPSDERIMGALEEVGLDDSFRFRFPHQLSGGQRQRIAVARALIMEPSGVPTTKRMTFEKAIDVAGLVGLVRVRISGRVDGDSTTSYRLVASDLTLFE